MGDLGADFVFCAGDHFDEYNPAAVPADYWTRYFDDCLAWNRQDPSCLLIPAPEAHCSYHSQAASVTPIMDACHTLIPSLDKSIIPQFLFKTLKASPYIQAAHARRCSVTICHPVVTERCGAPSVLNSPDLENMDYLGLEERDAFRRHYVAFLKRPLSAKMGAYSEVDSSAYRHPREHPGINRATYFYVENGFNPENLLHAWEKRRTYAVFGDFLHFTRLSPVPGLDAVRQANPPAIDFEAQGADNTEIKKVEIYRNGELAFDQAVCGKNSCSFSWKDDKMAATERHYVVCIETKKGMLVTSPIHFAAP
ncbi:MAG: hypothetical protein PHV34_25075 [Verrucomicrobiae bacterium]|nr:hypothetical protein [Verrucomicrobiae bacterium]